MFRLRLRVFSLEAGQIGRDVVVGHGFVQLDVFGNVDEHRTLPAGHRDDKRFLHHAGQVGHIGHQIVMLGDPATDFDDRRFLERVAADDFGADLAGDRDEWDAVELGVGDGGDEVGRAGPLVAMQTPGLPVLRAMPCAANAPPCSWRGRMVRSRSEKRVSAWWSGILAPPG